MGLSIIRIPHRFFIPYLPLLLCHTHPSLLPSFSGTQKKRLPLSLRLLYWFYMYFVCHFSSLRFTLCLAILFVVLLLSRSSLGSSSIHLFIPVSCTALQWCHLFYYSTTLLTSYWLVVVIYFYSFECCLSILSSPYSPRPCNIMIYSALLHRRIHCGQPPVLVVGNYKDPIG
ncbi:hypothetical protein BKA70DRAFT_1263309 [Coprinopsis sp. MPI-PUGE-AT-0042]|nr:hypothetical protein BKA70DRAFT_1263309 [Coprinopsis sp. MPI-PUGE-AT-0042]